MVTFYFIILITRQKKKKKLKNKQEIIKEHRGRLQFPLKENTTGSIQIKSQKRAFPDFFSNEMYYVLKKKARQREKKL